MNPCPCGYLGDPDRACRCSPEQVQRYRGRISGPLLDRIDMQVQVSRLPPRHLLNPGQPGESSACVRARVVACHALQLRRQGCSNAALAPEALLAHCALGGAENTFLEKAAGALQLSGRSLHRALRVARTVADLEGADRVTTRHLQEALANRTDAAPH
ncbi:MAG: ATP-binding protein, partial [Halioglobus sp.]|nr:ATP-binding protein [Halioglobus sp.]